MSIKKVVFGGIALFLVGVFCGYFAYYSYYNRLIRVKDFRGIKEGYFAPGFSATSDNGTHFTLTTPSGNFFVYFINENNPGIIQFDSEIGPNADIVIKNGGHISTNNDTKVLLAFKIGFYSEKNGGRK